MHRFFTILTIFEAVHFASAAIPSYINICRSTDPNIAQCIIDSVYELRTQLQKGIPELDVPPIEPLHLDEVKLRSGPNTAKIDANFTNLKVWGPSNFEILEMKPNIPKARFAFKVLMPDLYFEGDYDIDMKLLVLDYKGNGPMHGNFTNYTFDCVLKGKHVQQNGEEYLKFEKMHMRINIGKSYMHLDGLFKEDKLIASATGQVINDNSELFVNEIRPHLEEGLEEKFTEIANKITLKFTYKELFP